jgi:multidrug efflux system membrane fusion protein
VKSGDTVATISDEGRQAAVQQAQAQLDQRMSDYNANKKLIETGDAPRNTLAALEAGVKAAQAQLAAAQAEADRSLVRAPIDGVVDTVPVQVGQSVQVGTEIAEVVDPDPMLAVGAVSESRRASLLVGQSAEVRFIDGKKVSGSVDFVGLSADKATRTYPVEVKMPNPTSEIADGVTCEMTVLLAPIEAAAVPRSALVFSDDGRLGVRIADNDSKAQFVPVSLVDDGLSQVWVTGLNGVARVIVVGQDFVKDGDPVEAVTAAEASPQEPPA